MRLVTFGRADLNQAGFLIEHTVVSSTSAAQAANLWSPEDASRWQSVRQLVQLDGRTREVLHDSARNLANATPGSRDGVYLLSDVKLGAPVPDPDKIICLGLNYRDHAHEAGLKLPEAPMLFAKYRNSLTGPDDRVVLPYANQHVDYEAELAVVIGRRAKDVTEEEALDYVFGAMALNDVSARDVQNQTSQWMAGKAIDTFAPCGPSLVSLDEVGDLQDLAIATRVNGRTVQDANTSLMIFPVTQVVAFISRLMTLEPGDIIATGTPAGVGFKRQPPILLRHGDDVEVEVAGIGVLRNSIFDPAALATTH